METIHVLSTDTIRAFVCGRFETTSDFVNRRRARPPRTQIVNFGPMPRRPGLARDFTVQPVSIGPS